MELKLSQASCLLGCIAVAVAIASVGCSGNFDSSNAVAANNSSNIQRLANLYVAFQMKHQSQGPADEAEFREFIQDFSPVKLERMGISADKIGELFVSERDNEAFRIRYSVSGSLMGSGEAVIFESVGRSGKRMVGFLNMVQREVEQGEYESLWSGSSSTPSETRSNEEPGRD